MIEAGQAQQAQQGRYIFSYGSVEGVRCFTSKFITFLTSNHFKH